MNTMNQDAVLVIGVGKDVEGDDTLGCAVARSLMGTPGVRIVEESSEAADLMAAWDGAHTVIVVAEVAAGAEAGTVFRFDAESGPLPADVFGCKTHAYGVAAAVELCWVLGNLPPTLIVYGVEAGNDEAGSEPSAAAPRAVEYTAEEIRRDIEQLQQGAPCTSFR